MPDMIKNLVKGIEENKYKVSKATEGIAKEMKKSFELNSLNDSIISKMNRAVATETNSINASAMVKANNSLLNVTKLEANFEGSFNIDSKKAGTLLAPSISRTIKAGGLK